MTSVDVDDPEDLLNLVRERLLDLQIDERMPLYVIPLRTRERPSTPPRSVGPAVRRGQPAVLAGRSANAPGA